MNRLFPNTKGPPLVRIRPQGYPCSRRHTQRCPLRTDTKYPVGFELQYYQIIQHLQH